VLYKLPLLVVVLNDQALGAELHQMRAAVALGSHRPAHDR
jgi:hypothetical protein